MNANKQRTRRSVETASAIHVPALPAPVRRSRLMSRGAFDVFDALFDEGFHQQLLAEAQLQYVEAAACDVAVLDNEEVRGGVPPRRFFTSSGGVVQDSFYRAPWVLDLLRDLTVPALIPSGERGTYSYYVRPGDFLGIHRDIVTCDVAVITCLTNGMAFDDDGGSLCLYPERLTEPLSVIRSTPEQDKFKLFLKPGQTLVMYGGIVPHALLPVATGQTRVVSVLCYQIP